MMEVDNYLDLETGEVVMATDEARSDLEEIYDKTPLQKPVWGHTAPHRKTAKPRTRGVRDPDFGTHFAHSHPQTKNPAATGGAE
jgi:hypothetical protein